ncbi:uncharacterized protein LOC143606485 [Bidens hawaiensis]|uniref:uncharacterized protein LOC143606485 n=1 Tax=Bidens hawaiensis TaxID=980011 RepID=UPI00404ADD5B
MDSPSSSDIINRFFQNNGHTADEEAEEEAVTSVVTLATKYMQFINSPPRPVLKREYIERDHEGANDHLMKDYFIDSPRYKNPKTFRRRFRMSKHDYISATAPVASFWANDNYYPHIYYLGDEIYPEYSIIVKTFSDPMDKKRNYFKKVPESSQKDIERCLGVLRQRWHYMKNPCRAWTLEKMRDAMYTYIILHNMI